MIFGPNDYECKEYDLEFGIPNLERNNIISCDYRSKDEIIKCVEEKSKKIDVWIFFLKSL